MTRRITTTETSFEIIDLVKELDGATMPELSDRLDLANSTVHSHLKTLEANRLVVKEGNKYYLGLRFLQYGNYSKQRKPEYEHAKETVERLAKNTKEGSNFCVEEHGRVSVLFGDSTAEDPAYDIGNTFHMHNTAVGKAILAEMSNEEVSNVIAQWGLPEQTEHTITDEKTLFEELKEIRSQGYAFNREELLTGLSAAGAVVKHPDSSVLGALSVGGPTYRIEGQRLQEELPEHLLEAKRDLEEEIRGMYSFQ